MDNNWSATHDHMPGPNGPTNLYKITGTVTVPTLESDAKLVRAVDGINPKIMMLRVVISTPDGDASTVTKDVDVEYTEENSHEYESVTIIGDASGSVDVEHLE